MSSEATGTRKKPTKGYYVPSRYKQAAEASVQSSRSREKSPHDLTRLRDRPTEKETMQSTLRSRSNDGSICTKEFTSTPAIQGRCGLPVIDASAITDASGFLCVSKRNRNHKLTSAGVKQSSPKNKARDQTLKVGPSCTFRRTGSESNPANSVSAAEMNILYAEYLQAKLLESNAKEVVQKRSKYVAGKIHQIWCLMQELMIKNAQISKELDFVSYQIALHNHLHKQEEILLPALVLIPELENQYESIAKAVDTVRYKLEVKNISLPHTDFEEEVIQLLQKISDLIKTLKSMYNSDGIIFSAKVADIFTQHGKLVAEEVKRGAGLLSEANDLLLTETSLKLA